jgi:hypothetical protein
MKLDPDYIQTSYHLNIFLIRDLSNPLPSTFQRPGLPGTPGSWQPPYKQPYTRPGPPGTPGSWQPHNWQSQKREEFPANSDWRFSRVNYRLGVGSYFLKDLNRAVKAYQEAIKLDPRFTPALHNLAAIYFEQKEYAEAIALARAAINVNQRFPMDEPDISLMGGAFGQQGITQVMLGELLLRTGDVPGARAAFTAAAQQNTRWAYCLGKLPPKPVAPPPHPVGAPLMRPRTVAGQ